MFIVSRLQQRILKNHSNDPINQLSFLNVRKRCLILDVASGGSDDWAKGGAGIPYSYAVELRDTGDFGFLLPAE
jgi:hypothetical protein